MGKIDSYIGFAIKSRKVVYGLDSLEIYKKKVHLVLYTDDLAEKSLKKAVQIAETKNCPALQYNEFTKLLNKDNCKILAITNKELADAIIKNLV